MSDRFPEAPSEMQAEGVPDQQTGLDSKRITGDEQEGMAPPRDSATAVDDFGTTAAEQQEGEPLDLRLQREVPDVDATTPPDESAAADEPFSEAAGQDVGRLVQPDQGGRGDLEKDSVGTDAGTSGGGFSAEEAAIHVEPEA